MLQASKGWWLYSALLMSPKVIEVMHRRLGFRHKFLKVTVLLFNFSPQFELCSPWFRMKTAIRRTVAVRLSHQ